MNLPDYLYLHLTLPGHNFPNGLYRPDDYEHQRLALKHFSGGSTAIGPDKLDEVTYIAGLHGWKVVIRRPSANVPE